MKEALTFLQNNGSIISSIFMLMGIFIYAYFTGNSGAFKRIEDKIEKLATSNSEEHKAIKEWMIGEFALRDEFDQWRKELVSIGVGGTKYIEGAELRLFATFKIHLIIDWAMSLHNIGFSPDTKGDIIAQTRLAYEKSAKTIKQMLPKDAVTFFNRRHKKRTENVFEFLSDLCEDEVNNKQVRFQNFAKYFLESTISDLYKLSSFVNTIDKEDKK